MYRDYIFIIYFIYIIYIYSIKEFKLIIEIISITYNNNYYILYSAPTFSKDKT
jgi:hypothetical protein